MRIATYDHDGSTHVGIVTDAGVARLPADVGVIDLLTASAHERDGYAATAEEPTPLDGVKLRSPLHPPSVRDFVAFEQHIEGMLMTEGPGASVAPEWSRCRPSTSATPTRCSPPGRRSRSRRAASARLRARGRGDHRHARPRPDRRNARDHIAGYTIFNDWSARDLQGIDMKLKMGWAKGKDFASTLGPWIVTADELEPHRDDERPPRPGDDASGSTARDGHRHAWPTPPGASSRCWSTRRAAASWCPAT